MSGPHVGSGFGGSGGSGAQKDEDFEPLNHEGGGNVVQPTTKLSSGGDQQTLMQQAEYGLRQAEQFADEMVLTPIEKHTLFGRPITRRMSLAMVAGCMIAAIVLVVIIVHAITKGDNEPSAKFSAKEGRQRYELFAGVLMPLVGSSVVTEGTPEEEALHWLAFNDALALNPHANNDKVAQRFVLATIYFATRGGTWVHSKIFLNHKDECDWNLPGEEVIGAQCDESGSVDRLTLRSDNLDGTLPRDIGLLTHLTHVDLSGNKIQGELPSSLGNLGMLTHLDLSMNLVSGIASGTTPNWSNLQTLKLDINAFEGEIPFEYFVDLTALKTLDLSNNKFTGDVHDYLSDHWGMENLEELNLSNNNFEGLPLFLQEIESLTILDLSNNGFVGSFPVEFAQMKNLVSLDVSRNHLYGSLPDAFGENGDGLPLATFRASTNELEGSIPTKISNFPMLGIVKLDDNGLYGPLPSEIGLMENLEVLNVASNQLEGKIPTELGLCSSLRELELANNKLESSIPSQLGSALSLERVDLRHNLLLGLLPTELSNLPALDVLYVSSNAFMGDIDSAVCNRPSSVPSWSVLEADCLGDLLTCSCCTSCCNSGGECK